MTSRECRATNEDANGSGVGGNDENLNEGRRETEGDEEPVQKILWK